MRFLVRSSGRPRSRAPVRLFLAFAAVALAGWAVQRVRAGGLVAGEVEAYYLGLGGGDPIAPAALWEEIHMGAFVHGFTLFMLGALLAVSPVPERLRAALLGTAAGAALGDLFAPFAVLALGGAGVLRVLSFVAAALSSAALLGVVAVRFGAEGGGARAAP
jgi:hypothetical protein